jgi:hypothetical protein
MCTLASAISPPTEAQSTTLYAMARTGGAARTLASIPNEWWPTVTCDATSVIAVDGGGDAPVSMNLATNTSSVLTEGSGAAADSFMSGLVWELRESTAAAGSLGYLTALDPSAGLESSSRLSIPGTDSSELYLIAPTPTVLWVVGGTESLILHVTFG